MFPMSSPAPRWRRQPPSTGLARLTQGVRGWQLWAPGGTEAIIHVAPVLQRDNRWMTVGWYWYGLGQNTCSTPVGTAEKAKLQAYAYYKEHP